MLLTESKVRLITFSRHTMTGNMAEKVCFGVHFLTLVTKYMYIFLSPGQYGVVPSHSTKYWTFPSGVILRANTWYFSPQANLPAAPK